MRTEKRGKMRMNEKERKMKRKTRGNKNQNHLLQIEWVVEKRNG